MSNDELKKEIEAGVELSHVQSADMKDREEEKKKRAEELEKVKAAMEAAAKNEGA